KPLQVGSALGEPRKQIDPRQRSAERLRGAQPLLPEELERLFRGEALRHHDRVSDDVAPADVVDDHVDRGRAVEAILAGLKRSPASKDAEVGSRKQRAGEAPLACEALENPGRRRAWREEQRRGSKGTGGSRRMLQPMKQKNEGGDAEQDEQEKQPAEPADRAH